MEILEYLRDHLTLYRLSRELDKTRRSYGRFIREAETEKKSREDIGALIDEMRMECQYPQLEVDKFTTHRLLKTADRLLLPRPSYDYKSMWDTDNAQYGYPRLLTHEAMKIIRRNIRRERRERAEYYLKWVVPIIGIIGALTGLIAVWKR